VNACVTPSLTQSREETSLGHDNENLIRLVWALRNQWSWRTGCWYYHSVHTNVWSLTPGRMICRKLTLLFFSSVISPLFQHSNELKVQQTSLSCVKGCLGLH